MARRETEAQRQREYDLAKIRYDNGYREHHQNYYVENSDRYREWYLTKVKPKLNLPEFKEHKNNLQRERRAKEKALKLEKRKTLPFAEYKLWLAERRERKFKKKNRISEKKEAAKRLGKLHRRQVDRVISKLKLQSYCKEQRAKNKLADIFFVINRKRIYKKLSFKFKIHNINEQWKMLNNS